MKKITVCSLNETRYAETFRIFVERSLEYPMIVNKLVEVTHHLKPGFRLLDVGAGTGHVIRALSSQPGIDIGHYTAFEPNPVHRASLEETLGGLALGDYRVCGEPFSEITAIDGRFDLALFSHSLYWMMDPAACFLHAANALDSGGAALALIQGPYGVHTMVPLFEPFLDRVTPVLQNNAVSSHELVWGLRELGSKPEVQMLRTPVDLTGLFEPDCSGILSEFISFCLQLEFKTLPKPLSTDIIQYIQGGCVEKDGKLLWFLPNAAVLLSV